MTASLDMVATNKSPMQSKNNALDLDLNHENPLGKEDVDISSSSSDPPDTSNTDWNQITMPGLHDVLLGRGGGTNNHDGNVLFRKLVNEHKMRYLACSKVDKPKVAREVVQLWRKMSPPGRFLNRKDESKRGPGSVKDAENVWFEVGDKKAREKASQCLRERTAEVIPYMKQLREHQDAATEHGVSMIPQQLQMHNSNQVQPPDNHISTMNGNSMNGNSNHNQGQGQGSMNGNSNHNHNHNQGQGQGMNNSTHSMHNMYPHPSGAAAAPVPVFPRRNSQPGPPLSPQHASFIPQPYMGRRGSLPVSSAPQGQGQGQGQHTSPHLARRASLNMMPTSSAGGGGNGGGGGAGGAGGGVPFDEFYANTAPPLGSSGGMGGDEFYGDMTDQEYEQMIMMQRQHLQMQHMQIQRMRQQRGRAGGDTGGAGARRPSMTGITSSMGGGGGYELSPPSGNNGNHLQGQSYQQQQLQLLYPHMQQQREQQQQQQQQHHEQQQQQQQHHKQQHHEQQQQQQQNPHVHFSQEQDPLMYMANQTKSSSGSNSRKNSNNVGSIGAAARAGNLAAVAATTVSPRTSKRAVDESDYQIGVATPSPASLNGSRRGQGRSRQSTSDAAPPDVALSSGATFPEAATADHDDVDCAPQDGELTLEEYRQQLEAYMSNNPTSNHQEHHEDDQLDSPSDLEDDWEKERDRAFKKEKKRGVGRNVSGVSFMSTKTDNSKGMSLVSGMSMFSADLMSMGTTTRDNKMNMGRSISSNLSLMSELTDLSQNIDDLHLFDE
jgi:hypothetical protein